jgi:hypothetical protein
MIGLCQIVPEDIRGLLLLARQVKIGGMGGRLKCDW